MTSALQPSIVPLHKLLSTCIDAAARGCDRIRAVQSSGEKDATLKLENDPKSALTAADLAAQAAVVGALTKAWPGLTIVGEEDESVFAEDHQLDVPLDDAILDGEPTASIDLASAKIFVDPLDGTREFVEGRLDAVQCLVGVAVGDTPVAGVVGIPFPADGGPPRVIWATAGGTVGGDAPRAKKREDDTLLVVAGDGSDPAQVAAVAAFPGADFAVFGASGNKLKLVAEGAADVAVLHCKTSAWDTCAPTAAIVAAGGRVTDYFGAPLASYTGAVGNTLGVIASSARASKAHEAACATLRRDARAVALLEKYGVRGSTHATDVARDLAGVPLTVAAVAAAAGVDAASYHAPEAEAFRGGLSAGCRLRLDTGPSVFLKRIKIRELPAAVKKATAQPQKLRRDVASFRVEAAFLSSDAAKGLVAATGVQVPAVLSAAVDTPTDDPLDAASLLFLRDFSPDDGYVQSNLLEGADLRATLKALARFHAHFWADGRGPKPKADEAWRCGGHWQPSYQNPGQFEGGVADAWPRLLENFRSVLDASPATRSLPLEALGKRLQRAAVAAGRAAHPFAHDDASADVEQWRTLIHGDLKAANVLVKDGETAALLDFQFVGHGLAATDLAHFLTASVASSELLGDDGSLVDGALVDLYHAELVAALGRDVPVEAFRHQLEVAIVDKARFVFSYLWPRIDASPTELERGAQLWNRNSYNKDVRAAVWLVARTSTALDAAFSEL